MSGGTFDYGEYRITDIADEIENILSLQGKKSDNYFSGEYPVYSDEVQARLREAVKILRVAYVYAKRADCLFAGDDGEESFLERLEAELKQLEQ